MSLQVLRLRATVFLARVATAVLLLFGIFFLAQVLGSCGGAEEKPGEEPASPDAVAETLASAAAPEPAADKTDLAGTALTDAAATDAATADDIATEPAIADDTSDSGNTDPGNTNDAATEPAAALGWRPAAERLARTFLASAMAAASWLWDRALHSGPGNLALGFLLLWLAGRFYLYGRYTGRALDGLPAGSAAAEPRLLSSQQGLVDELTRNVLSDGIDEAPRLIALKGGWGSGKSFLLQVFRRRLESGQKSAGKVVVVHVDIWRHSTERDLHLALFEALLSHPDVPPFPALFRYPMALIPVLLLRYFSRVFQQGQIEVSGLKVALTLPVLLWQQSLEHAVAVSRRRGRRVVWILDEIDRCSPELAQGAVALARRALSLPGCIVILPYVPEQLRYKVFNPLRLTRPDIDSTLQALIFDYATGVDPTLSPIQALHLEELLAATYPAGGRTKGSGEGDGPETGRADLLEKLFAWRLASWFGESGSGVRDRLAYLFEEKYLSMVLPIRKLGLEDAVEMVEIFPTLHPYFEQFLSRNGLEDVERAVLRAQLVAALRAYLARPGSQDQRQPAPMIRHLEGELILQLRDLAQAPEPLAQQAPEGFKGADYARTVLATALILAFRRSWELVRKRGAGRLASEEEEHG